LLAADFDLPVLDFDLLVAVLEEGLLAVVAVAAGGCGAAVPALCAVSGEAIRRTVRRPARQRADGGVEVGWFATLIP
jgi:hypothetical protein